MKAYVLPLLIIAAVVSLMVLGVWLLFRGDSTVDELSRITGYSKAEINFLKQEGFLDNLDNIDSENLPSNKEQIVSLLKSPTLIEQNLNNSDESFEVLATKLNISNKSYQLAFKLENKSNESKEFYLIPISEKDQLQFKEIKGLVNSTNLLSLNKDDVQKQALETLYDVEQHKQELRTELSQAYKDIEKNNYKAEPIKIVLGPKSTIIAKSEWEINRDPVSGDLKPVYFLVYGSAAGAKEELTILNVHSHPGQGDNWEVEFTVRGMADLKIIPADQATIDDDEFKGLFCDDEERFPQILEGDVIYYPNWQCSGIGKVVHYTLKAGKHTLRFEFGDQISYAYNSPDLIFHDGFETGGAGAPGVWTSTTGTLSYSATTHTGSYSLETTTDSEYVTKDFDPTPPNSGSLWFRFNAAPSGDVSLVTWNSTYEAIPDAHQTYYIYLTSNRKLKVGGGTEGSTVLDVDTWYRISWYSEIASNLATIYLNGISEATGSSGITGENHIVRVGQIQASDRSITVLFDDVVIGDDAAAPQGDIRTLVALPKADGANRNFLDDESGTTRPFFDSANQLPSDGAVDDTYVWYDDSDIGGDSEETFALQNSSAIGLGAGDTINAVNIVVRMKRGNGQSVDHQIVEYDTANTETVLTLGTSFATYTKYSATAPTSGAWDQDIFDAYEIGAGNAGDGGQDTYISSAIAMVAYTPAAAPEALRIKDGFRVKGGLKVKF